MAKRMFRITGQVQGVGFRFWTLEQARRLELTGYVRNAPDGSVEVWAVGEPDVLKDLHDLLWRGPPGARVTSVEDLPPRSDPPPTGFEIRR